MRMNLKKAAIATATSAALAFSSGAALAQSLPSASVAGNQCSVSLDRSAQSGSFSVARHVAPSGNCTCAVTTGPSSQPNMAEQRVAALQSSRNCSSAPSINFARAPISDDASEFRGSPSLFLAFLGAAAAIVGIIIIADDDEDDAPVSP